MHPVHAKNKTINGFYRLILVIFKLKETNHLFKLKYKLETKNWHTLFEIQEIRMR